MNFAFELRQEQLRIAGAAKWWLLAYLVAVSGLFLYLDLFYYDEPRIYGLLGIVGWAFGYLLFVGIMQAAGYFRDGKKTGVGTYFVLGMAIGIPVAIGFILLIIPGLYLRMRWLPAFSRAMATEDGVTNSMRWSWNQSKPHQAALSLAMIPPVFLFVLPVGLQRAYEVFYEFLDWNGYVALSVVSNLASSLATAWFTVLGAAVYGCVEFLSPQDGTSI